MSKKSTEAARLFNFVSHKARLSMRRCFEESGITMPQGIVLSILFEHGEMKVSEISKKIRLSNSTVSGIIDRLERQNRVERIRSKDDKRVVNVKIAKEFINEHEGIKKIAERSFEKLLNKGTKEEIDKILEGLEILNRILDNNH
ncbi:MAG: MarR family transcriptional regulator [Clostridiales bacterium]